MQDRSFSLKEVAPGSVAGPLGRQGLEAKLTPWEVNRRLLKREELSQHCGHPEVLKTQSQTGTTSSLGVTVSLSRL